MKRLQDKDDKDLRKDRELNSWQAYLASPIYGKSKETDNQKLIRETKRIQKLAVKRIKGSKLRKKDTNLKRFQDVLQDVNNKITIEKEYC